MATMSKSIDASPVLEQYHVYHAEAHLLSGHLEHPIKQPIENYGRVLLENTRRESLFTESVGETNIEGLISFTAGRTRVMGTQLKNKKDIWGVDHSGWVTQSTSVIEGLNVADIVTADRMIAQISTEHPMINGHVPKVSFLGTRFENLRIAGYEVKVELNLNFCGNKPQGDRPYLQDDGFLDSVEKQLNSVGDFKKLPEVLQKRYDAKVAYIDDLRKRANAGANGGGGRTGDAKLQCSLVKSIAPIPGVEIFGNMLFIPGFGTVSLAEIEVGIGHYDSAFHNNSGDGSTSGKNDSNYFTLHMLNMHLGCPVGATTQAGTAKSNGQTNP